ncbi:hypothetical protein F5Y14DRAFT_161452 [Nemania sp. NC0429]|nr:hypothetical protein F5Y14DRAFT_161452 [Nemania sp. NC0429]
MVSLDSHLGKSMFTYSFYIVYYHYYCLLYLIPSHPILSYLIFIRKEKNAAFSLSLSLYFCAFLCVYVCVVCGCCDVTSAARPAAIVGKARQGKARKTLCLVFMCLCYMCCWCVRGEWVSMFRARCKESMDRWTWAWTRTRTFSLRLIHIGALARWKSSFVRSFVRSNQSINQSIALKFFSLDRFAV